MTTEYTDKWGYSYRPIEELDLKTRNDFTLEEFIDVVGDGEESFIDIDYHWHSGTDENGYSLTETHPNGNPKYMGVDRSNPKGFRLLDVSDAEFEYEGGTIQGFGTFTNVTSGNLGDGHDAWSLFRHEESGRLFLLTGWYSSWDSGEMDDWHEVKEAEVKVVRYQDLKTGTIFDNPAVTV